MFDRCVPMLHTQNLRAHSLTHTQCTQSLNFLQRENEKKRDARLPESERKRAGVGGGSDGGCGGGEVKC